MEIRGTIPAWLAGDTFAASCQDLESYARTNGAILVVSCLGEGVLLFAVRAADKVCLICGEKLSELLGRSEILVDKCPPDHGDRRISLKLCMDCGKEEN